LSSSDAEFSLEKDESIISHDLIKAKYNNTILDLERKITLAKGQNRVDLLVKNANIINVFSGDIYKTDVAIADGIFVGFGEEYDFENLYDAQGRFMCPGLIDGHIHIESTFLSPREFCNVVAVHGTSAVICDPHEIANVLGLKGIDYFLQSSLDIHHNFNILMNRSVCLCSRNIGDIINYALTPNKINYP
jgi:adenine deaminase